MIEFAKAHPIAATIIVLVALGMIATIIAELFALAKK